MYFCVTCGSIGRETIKDLAGPCPKQLTKGGSTNLRLLDEGRMPGNSRAAHLHNLTVSAPCKRGAWRYTVPNNPKGKTAALSGPHARRPVGSGSDGGAASAQGELGGEPASSLLERDSHPSPPLPTGGASSSAPPQGSDPGSGPSSGEGDCTGGSTKWRPLQSAPREPTSRLRHKFRVPGPP